MCSLRADCAIGSCEDNGYEFCRVDRDGKGCNDKGDAGFNCAVRQIGLVAHKDDNNVPLFTSNQRVNPPQACEGGEDAAGTDCGPCYTCSESNPPQCICDPDQQDDDACQDECTPDDD